MRQTKVTFQHVQSFKLVSAEVNLHANCSFVHVPFPLFIWHTLRLAACFLRPPRSGGGTQRGRKKRSRERAKYALPDLRGFGARRCVGVRRSRFKAAQRAAVLVDRSIAVRGGSVLLEKLDANAKRVIARNQNTPSAIARIAIAATAVRAARIRASGLISCLLASGKYQAAARIP